MNIAALIKRRSLIALMITAVSAAIFWAGYGQPDPKAYLFPIIVGALMLLFALLSLVRETIGIGADDFQSFPWAKQLPALVVTAAGILLIEIVGMYATSAAMLFIVTYWYSSIEETKKRLIHSAAFSVGFCFIMYLLFSVMLNVQLPRGFAI